MSELYYCKTPEQSLKAQKSIISGLTSGEAEKRLQEVGLNQLSEGKKKSALQVFAEQFKDLLVIILLAAALISAISGNVESTLVIFAVLILNAVLGTVQYFKAEKSLESLKAMSSPTAKILRDGKKTESPSPQVVPGDIVLLEAGDELSSMIKKLSEILGLDSPPVAISGSILEKCSLVRERMYSSLGEGFIPFASSAAPEHAVLSLYREYKENG